MATPGRMTDAKRIQTLGELCFLGHFGPQIGNVQTAQLFRPYDGAIQIPRVTGVALS